jgi:hypothetical protein
MAVPTAVARFVERIPRIGIGQFAHVAQKRDQVGVILFVLAVLLLAAKGNPMEGCSPV